MVKWTEVSAYSGMPVDEDAPTNATGAAVAGTGDDSSVVVVKKKKKIGQMLFGLLQKISHNISSLFTEIKQ